MASLYSEVTV